MNNCIFLDFKDGILTLVANSTNINKVQNNFNYNAIKHRVDFHTEDGIHFKDDLDFKVVTRIINKMELIADSIQVDLIKCENLNKYTNSHNLYAAERRELGNYIKSSEVLNNIDYLEFRDTVNSILKRQLRDKQMQSAYHISRMRRSANFSVPGAGKTSMVYGAFAYLNTLPKDNRNYIKRIVMIGPLSSFKAWIDEFYENFGMQAKLKVLNSKDFSKTILTEKLLYEIDNYNLILINYDRVKSISKVLKRAIDDKTFLVLDEVHRIKNTKGVYAQAVRNVSVNANCITVLTGTPIPNGYIDIFNMLYILYAHEYDNIFGFSEQDLYRGNTNNEIADIINEKIRPFFMRVNKKQLDVPTANEDEISKINATLDEIKLYQMILNKPGNFFEKYIRLLQISLNPENVAMSFDELDKDCLVGIEIDTDFAGIDTDIPETMVFSRVELNAIRKIDPITSKLIHIIKYVVKLSSESKPILIWAIFRNSMAKIQKELSKVGLESFQINGSIDLEERENIINKFNNGEIKILIANPQTMAESVSLHKTCHDAVYAELNFNLAQYLQSKDRIHRLGLENGQETNYHIMQSIYGANSIEEIVYNRLKQKADIMYKAIDNEFLRPNNIGEDSIDDIINLVMGFN